MTARKPRVRGGAMVARAYPVLEDAVESGVAYGLRRAYKHEDAGPSETELDRVAPFVVEAVVNDVCERFDFEEARDD